MLKLHEVMADIKRIYAGHVPSGVASLVKCFDVLRQAVRGGGAASNRMPVRLQMEITDKCNFNCIMCNRRFLKQKRANMNSEIPFDACVQLIDEIKPIYFTVNGLGEPLLYKNIPDLLKLCRSKNIYVSMPTNMSLLDDDRLAALIENPPSILTFSLHGATPQTFAAITMTPAFEQCVSNFERLLSLRTQTNMKIRILFALQKNNVSDYGPMFKLLKKWNMLDRFNCIPVFDFNVSNDEETRINVTSSEKDHVLRGLREALCNATKKDEKDFLEKWRTIVMRLRSIKEIQDTGPCIVPWYSTYVTATGDVLPCCFLTNENYVMGNIYKQSFREIWNGAEYRRFRETLRDHRERIKECYGCVYNGSALLKRYGFLAFGNSKWDILSSNNRTPRV